MNTIVLNTLTGSASEYDWPQFQSITPTHAGDVTGLMLFGGNVDADQPIIAQVMTGKTLWSTSLKKLLDLVYFAMKGSGTSDLVIRGEAATYSYPFAVRATGVSRAKPGRGIRENYLAFGYSNTDGADFQIDRIEVQSATSQNRKV